MPRKLRRESSGTAEGDHGADVQDPTPRKPPRSQDHPRTSAISVNPTDPTPPLIDPKSTPTTTTQLSIQYAHPQPQHSSPILTTTDPYRQSPHPHPHPTQKSRPATYTLDSHRAIILTLLSYHLLNLPTQTSALIVPPHNVQPHTQPFNQHYTNPTSNSPPPTAPTRASRRSYPRISQHPSRSTLLSTPCPDPLL